MKYFLSYYFVILFRKIPIIKEIYYFYLHRRIGIILNRIFQREFKEYINDREVGV